MTCHCRHVGFHVGRRGGSGLGWGGRGAAIGGGGGGAGIGGDGGGAAITRSGGGAAGFGGGGGGGGGAALTRGGGGGAAAGFGGGGAALARGGGGGVTTGAAAGRGAARFFTCAGAGSWFARRMASLIAPWNCLRLNGRLMTAKVVWGSGRALATGSLGSATKSIGIVRSLGCSLAFLRIFQPLTLGRLNFSTMKRILASSVLITFRAALPSPIVTRSKLPPGIIPRSSATLAASLSKRSTL